MKPRLPPATPLALGSLLGAGFQLSLPLYLLGVAFALQKSFRLTIPLRVFLATWSLFGLFCLPFSQPLSPHQTITGVVTQNHPDRFPPLIIKRDYRRETVALASRQHWGAKTLQKGDRVRVRLGDQISIQARNPGERHSAQWLSQLGVSGYYHINELWSSSRAAWWQPLSKRLDLTRQQLREALTHGVEAHSPAAEVILGMTLGISPNDSKIAKSFRDSGTSHLFAVSGLHVSMIGVLLWAILKFLTVPRKVSVILIILGVSLYAMIVGFEAPVFRASIMAFIYLCAFLFQRRPHALNAVLLSVPIVLLIDPSQIFTVGFQLSYFVVLILILCGPSLYRGLRFIYQHDPLVPRTLLTPFQRYREKLVGAGWQLLATSLLAFLASSLLVLYHFQRLTPMGVLASAMLVPLASIIVMGAFLIAPLFFLVPGIHASLNQFIALTANGALYLAESASEVPSWKPTSSCPWEGGLVVYDLPGNQRSMHLDSPNGGILIDCGKKGTWENHTQKWLHRYGKRPSTVILTHWKPDCAGSLSSLIKDPHIKTIFGPPHSQWANHPKYHEITQSTLLNFGPYHVSLFPVPETSPRKSPPLGCLVQFENTSLLWSGRLEYFQEKRIFENIDPINFWIRSSKPTPLPSPHFIAPHRIIETDTFGALQLTPEIWQQSTYGAIMIDLRHQKISPFLGGVLKPSEDFP